MARALHILESDLALFASGDAPLWRQPGIRWHLAGCRTCRQRVAAHREDRNAVRRMAEDFPAGLPWDRLAAEMTANIRVGLAAGECVAPRRQRRAFPSGWRLGAVLAGFAALLTCAWWVNVPPSETVAFGGAIKKIAQAIPWPGAAFRGEDRGPLVEVSAAGIQLRENGGVLGMSQGVARPVSVTLSAQGSARARYVDSETGQVTITGVYAQ